MTFSLMQKIGNKDASNLISEWLSNGKIYNGQIPIRVSIDEKKDRLFRLNYKAFFRDGTVYEDYLYDNNIVDVLKSEVPEIEHCSAYRLTYNPRLEFNKAKLVSSERLMAEILRSSDPSLQ